MNYGKIGATNLMYGDWQNPYVTNNLVGMWDVEWNAGASKHDARLGKAVNLAPSEIGEATLSSDYWTIGEKVATKTAATQTFISYPSQQWYEGNMLAANGYTMEIVCNVANFTFSSPNLIATAELNGLMAGNSSLAGFWASNQHQGRGNFSSVAYISASIGQGLHYFAMSVTIGSQTLLRIDGATSTNTANTGITGVQYYIYNRNLICLGCHPTGGAPQGAGWQFATARVYNRALTASEIAANYAIDRVRFNLP